MIDGVRTITDVRHVSISHKSLLSMGVLSIIGMRIVVDDKRLRVTKGSLAMMKMCKLMIFMCFKKK